MTAFNEKIEEIIKIEWEMFQNVRNIGGRAACQDDWETFYIMRGSQFMCWTDQMTGLYLLHLKNAQKKGRNLISEKYGRMMKHTYPAYYKAEIEPFLPPVSEHAEAIVKEILSLLLIWEKEFAEKYPQLSKAGRPVTSNEDEKGITSMETYERGELCTYSDSLLDAYLDYVKELKIYGKSLSMMQRNVMVRLYGYSSIEEAESAVR